MNKILILEDDPGVARVYSNTLQAAGYDVRVFHQFDDARRALINEPPDGLLTDVRVAEYNGLQLALMFRMSSPNGRILVVSGHGDVTIRREADKIGADFRVKPIDLDALIRFFAPSHEQ